jgi:formate/nitrite transporter FocA (FNT family)
MLHELAKPVALLLCIVSLCAVFYTAFLVPATDLEQRIWDSLALLSLAAGICLSSGMIFRETAQNGANLLLRTLPVQIFCWALGLMLLLFAASWYLETHCIFYKDVRRL